ncbi:MAG: hypothetical protein HFE63_11140 [Clostridiales bacterium]|nr:hypothetical protein [Clostridiales bacterium]
METTIERIRGDKHLTVHTDETAVINRLLRLADEQPDKVQIMHRYEYDGELGGITAAMPADWFVLPRQPKKMNYTDEQRAELGDRLRRSLSKTSATCGKTDAEIDGN